ncbi:hypothetical protein EJB05_42169, partial [Eragrostis curvula]
GPFLVVFVCIIDFVAHLCTYAQGATAWSEPLQLGIRDYISSGDDVVGHTILAGDALCFTVGRKVLRYDVARHALSEITAPFMNSANVCLVTLENGELGATADANGHDLSLWWYDGFGGWKKHGIINLDITECRVLGFAEGAIFVKLGKSACAVMIDQSSSSFHVWRDQLELI